MRLYKAKFSVIAKDAIELLVNDGDIDVEPDNREDAMEDLVAIMVEFNNRDYDLRNRVRDYMSDENIPADRKGKIRNMLAERMGHPRGDDVARFLCRQFVECMMISRFVEEVYTEDRLIYRKLMGVLRSHEVDERAIRDEAKTRVKNVKEGTVDYEIALHQAIKDVKKRSGLH